MSKNWTVGVTLGTVPFGTVFHLTIFVRYGLLVMPLLLYVNNLSRWKLSTSGMWVMKTYIFVNMKSTLIRMVG